MLESRRERFIFNSCTMFIWKGYCGKIAPNEDLKQDKFIFYSLEHGSPRSSCWNVWFFRKPLSLLCREMCLCVALLCVRTSLLLLPLLRRTSIRLHTLKRSSNFTWLLNLVFWDRTLVNSPGWSGIPHPPASASLVLGLCVYISYVY